MSLERWAVAVSASVCRPATRFRLLLAALFTVTATIAHTSDVFACPNCDGAGRPLSEQLAVSDAVVLVQWVEGRKAREVDGRRLPSSTTYRVREVVRSAQGAVTRGQKISLFRYRVGRPGDLFLLMGDKVLETEGERIDWGVPLEVSETSYQYIVQAPSPESPPRKRLAYFMKFLEFPDQLIATDAYFEFAKAPYQHIVDIRQLIPRDKVRRWVTSPGTSRTRLGFYGTLLGLCGDDEDAELLLRKIMPSTAEFRTGINGMMSGYLLLAGDKGLDEIDRLQLKNRFLHDVNGEFLLDRSGRKRPIPFGETFATMQAMRFMWTYAEGRIAPERLRQSMRLVLDRPEFADLVIANLARWKDWSIQDRLMVMYDDKDFQNGAIRRATIRYLLVCIKDRPQAGPVPPHVVKARKNLETLREKDPKTVSQAERYVY